jgi:hypothetical protein
MYIPEVYRYKVRTLKPEWVSDSNAFAKLVIHILNTWDENSIEELLQN